MSARRLARRSGQEQRLDDRAMVSTRSTTPDGTIAPVPPILSVGQVALAPFVPPRLVRTGAARAFALLTRVAMVVWAYAVGVIGVRWDGDRDGVHRAVTDPDRRGRGDRCRMGRGGGVVVGPAHPQRPPSRGAVPAHRAGGPGVDLRAGVGGADEPHAGARRAASRLRRPPDDHRRRVPRRDGRPVPGGAADLPQPRAGAARRRRVRALHRRHDRVRGDLVAARRLAVPGRSGRPCHGRPARWLVVRGGCRTPHRSVDHGLPRSRDRSFGGHARARAADAARPSARPPAGSRSDGPGDPLGPLARAAGRRPTCRRRARRPHP